jgi:hypothetical protein
MLSAIDAIFVQLSGDIAVRHGVDMQAIASLAQSPKWNPERKRKRRRPYFRKTYDSEERGVKTSLRWRARNKNRSASGLLAS